jgi:hypothetical protein
MTKIRKMQLHKIIDRIQKQDKLCFHGKIKYMTMLNQLLRDKVEITKKLEYKNISYNPNKVNLGH